MTWTFQGSPSQTTTGFVPRPLSGTECGFDSYDGSIFPAGEDAGAERLVEGYFDVTCNGGGQGAFDFVASMLGDIRAWSVGTFTLVAPNGSFATDYFPDVATSGAAVTNCTVGNLDGITMTVVVETATGGAAPYPKLVTDDFVRTFRLGFDTSTVTPTMNGGAVCDFPVTGQASLHLTQTAADYVYNPNAPCVCE